MKSSITLTKTEPTVSFPKLMVSHYNIVLFHKEREGVVVGNVRVATHERKYLGEYRNDWLMNAFKDFTGEVVLSN
jgi:hypothetical protein